MSMTARQVYEGVLVEMNKVQAPSMLLEDFNYFINKAVNQYINKKYNVYDVNQQSTDDLRVLKSTMVINVVKTNLYGPQTAGVTGRNALLGAVYEAYLPQDYVHMLNCICNYRVRKQFKCYDPNTYVQFGATRLTADLWGQILNNFYMKPSYKKPYYYLHNVNPVVPQTLTPVSGTKYESDYGYTNTYQWTNASSKDVASKDCSNNPIYGSNVNIPSNPLSYAAGTAPQGNQRQENDPKASPKYGVWPNEYTVNDPAGATVTSHTASFTKSVTSTADEGATYYEWTQNAANDTQQTSFTAADKSSALALATANGWKVQTEYNKATAYLYTDTPNKTGGSGRPTGTPPNSFYTGTDGGSACTQGDVNITEQQGYSNLPRVFTFSDGTKGSLVEKDTASRLANPSQVRIEIRTGKDDSVFALESIYIDYIKAPQYIRLTQEQIDLTEDTSQMMEFPDYVCQEIINELTHLIMENSSDPRLQSHMPLTMSIANPAQGGQAQQESSK